MGGFNGSAVWHGYGNGRFRGCFIGEWIRTRHKMVRGPRVRDGGWGPFHRESFVFFIVLFVGGLQAFIIISIGGCVGANFVSYQLCRCRANY